MMLRLMISVMLVVMGSNPALAGQQCYATPEVEAEQLLRLHSQLMVVAITCRTDSQGLPLVSAYTSFTKGNIASLHHAEEVMKLYYKRTHGGDGVAELDQLRTRLGNEYGKKIADLSAPIFCQMYRDDTLRLCHASSGELRDEVTHRMNDSKTYVPQCVPSSASSDAQG